MNREVLQNRIDEYNETVKKEFTREISNTRIIPWLFKSFFKRHDKDTLLSIKSLLDNQMIRYKEIMAFVEGYRLGSNTDVNIKFEKIEKQIIPKLTGYDQYIFDECELELNSYPDNLISTITIKEFK